MFIHQFQPSATFFRTRERKGDNREQTVSYKHYICTKRDYQTSGFPCCSNMMKELQRIPEGTLVSGALNWCCNGALCWWCLAELHG